MFELDVPLQVHPLRVQARTLTPLVLPAFHGANLRGGLFGALRAAFCANITSPSCAACDLHGVCPIARLAATVADDSIRGQETPRPFVLRPAVDLPARLPAGSALRFGITLLGDGVSLFPYVLKALQELGKEGLGNRALAPGRFAVERVLAHHPLTGETQPVYLQQHRMVQAPRLPVTADQVRAAAAALPSDRLRLRFVTPLRLVREKELVRTAAMRPLVQRLLRRLTDLSANFAPRPLQADFSGLLAHADTIVTSEDATRWITLDSYSSRTGSSSAIGGLIGEAEFTGDLAPLRELLLWLTLVSVGKNTTKGDGVVDLLAPAAERPTP